MKQSETKPSGICIHGIIHERMRRHVNDDKTKPLIVTYVVYVDAEHYFYVDDFEPETIYEADQPCTIPIYVKAYKKRNGDPAYNLCVRKDSAPIKVKGERF